MSLTYTQLVSAIESYTECDEATFVTNIPTFVRQAEERIYTSVQLPATRTNATSSLTISNSYYTLPTGFLAPYALAVINASGVYSWLLFKDAEWIREAYSNPTTTGLPRYYAIYDKTTYQVAPTPDAGYSIELHYYKHPESIVTASTTWLGDNYDAVLLYGSLVEAYVYLKGEKDLIEVYDLKFKEGLALLKKVADGMDRQDTYRVEQTRIAVK